MYPDIDSIACFVAAAKTLNFRAAARSVALTPAALGKRIAQLEELMGGRLFERTTRHVSLTPAGQALLPQALKLLDVAEACVEAGRGRSGPAPVKLLIGTRHELGISWILPMLPALEEALPHVEIDLYFGSGPDLEERVKNFDVQCAVTSRVFVDPIFDVIRLVREDYVFVGSPRLLAEKPLATVADAAHHVLVDVQPEKPLFRYLRDAEGAPDFPRFSGERIMGTTAAVRHVLLDEQGVGVLPEYLVRADLKTGRLVRVLPSLELRFDYFRLMHRHDDPRADLYQRLAELMRPQSLS